MRARGCQFFTRYAARGVRDRWCYSHQLSIRFCGTSSVEQDAAALRTLAAQIVQDPTLAQRLAEQSATTQFLDTCRRVSTPGVAESDLPASSSSAAPASSSAAPVASSAVSRLFSDVEPPTARQKRLYFIHNFIPFIGFGFFDNAVMLIAGDYFDAKLGLAFGITTMGAAALGNTVSDVCGLWMSGFIETGLAASGLPASGLTSAQRSDIRMRILKNSAMISGITIGCLIGCFPLIFPDEWRLWESREQLEHEHEHDQ